eukprot:scaffold6174_cov125-Isochrysis_galbana.AAC.22
MLPVCGGPTAASRLACRTRRVPGMARPPRGSVRPRRPTVARSAGCRTGRRHSAWSSARSHGAPPRSGAHTLPAPACRSPLARNPSPRHWKGDPPPPSAESGAPPPWPGPSPCP